jgi:hypothetical protein
MWPVTFRDQGPQSSPTPSNPAPGPNYSAIVAALLELRQIPDWAGETVLDSSEAARIRTCGFTARKGLWRCPPLPWEFLGLYPPLWHLSDDIDPAMRPVVWHPKRATFRQISPIDPLSKHERQIAPVAPQRSRRTADPSPAPTKSVAEGLDDLARLPPRAPPRSGLHHHHRPRLDLPVRPRGVRGSPTTSAAAPLPKATLCKLALRIKLLIANRPNRR